MVRFCGTKNRRISAESVKNYAVLELLALELFVAYEVNETSIFVFKIICTPCFEFLNTVYAQVSLIPPY